MPVFYFFAALLICQAVASLRGGVRYLKYIRRELARPVADFAPFASVIVPCRGLDQGLHANLAALLRQSYPAFEIIFVVDSDNDSALNIIELTQQSFAGHTSSPSSRIVIAGQATESGQKVHNLIAAVREVDARTEVFVFVDSDARPHREWLRALVAPLAAADIGATTGYRWFIPAHGGLASHLRAVWNASIASALGENTRRNFCWGGSTAMRRATFAQLDISERWRGTLSDDFTMTRALQAARLPIRFVPRCLTASHEDCTLGELCEFTTRQVKITRIYAPPLWKLVLGSNLLFVATFYGGLALTGLRYARGLPFALPLTLIGIIYALGSLKSLMRLRAVARALAPEHQVWRIATICAHVSLWPFTCALFLYNALAAAGSRRIEWRGITYELKSPTETVIINPHASNVAAEDETARRV